MCNVKQLSACANTAACKATNINVNNVVFFMMVCVLVGQR